MFAPGGSASASRARARACSNSGARDVAAADGHSRHATRQRHAVRRRSVAEKAQPAGVQVGTGKLSRAYCQVMAACGHAQHVAPPARRACIQRLAAPASGLQVCAHVRERRATRPLEAEEGLEGARAQQMLGRVARQDVEEDGAADEEFALAQEYGQRQLVRLGVPVAHEGDGLGLHPRDGGPPSDHAAGRDGGRLVRPHRLWHEASLADARDHPPTAMPDRMRLHLQKG